MDKGLLGRLDELLTELDVVVMKKRQAERCKDAATVAAVIVAVWLVAIGASLLLGLLLFGDRWLEPTVLMVVGVTVMAIVACVKLMCRILRGGDVDQSGDR